MVASLDTSDQALRDGWRWAVGQALQYVRHGDPVGDWFEAALPGRNGFCMRDTAHQSTGAQVLGLRGETKNMLRRFAENISASRDWCSFWEISGDNLPVIDDYRSDQDFWYNLPANFDILDCCWRQYLWTGDTDYIQGPVFLNFYEHTVTDYVSQWDMDGDGLLENRREYGIRGIGSYEEAIGGIRTGGDLAAAQAAAYEAYSHIQQQRSFFPDAKLYFEKANQIRLQYNRSWWNSQANTFYSILQHDGHFSTQINFNINNMALYFGLVQDSARIRHDINDLERRFAKINVEAQSYFPEVAFRFGYPEIAYKALTTLMHPELNRREYPEIAYSVVGAIVTGLMGITGDATQNLITSKGQLTGETEWITVTHLPILQNQISVTHQENQLTTLHNEQGPDLVWTARFVGTTDYLMVDSVPMSASITYGLEGQVESTISIKVHSGEKHVVTFP
jgi:hypothetical protein